MRTAFVLLLSFVFANSQNSCPSREDIKPCECKNGRDGKPWISCEGIKSADELIKIMQSMEGLSVSNFYLDKSNIGILPSVAFSEMEIQNIALTNTNLTKMSENRNVPPFLGQENSLETLEVRNAFGDVNSPLSFLSLSHLKKLTLIHFEGNIMPTIGNNWFESGPYSLKELYFYSSNTSTVGSNAFHALVNLRAFTLTGGTVSEFARDMLPQPAYFLEIIDLSKNKLETLPSNMFSKMPSLNEVYLENNQFATIEEVIWAPVWSQLQTVFFFSNPIKCDKNIKWIYKYRIPDGLKGRCASPKILLNKDLGNVTMTDLEQS